MQENSERRSTNCTSFRIRLARPQDVGAIMQMGHEFYNVTQEAAWGFNFRASNVEQTIRTLMEREVGFLLVADTRQGPKGMIACTDYECWFHDARQLIEMWWWVDPEWRGTNMASSLAVTAEDVARKAGYDTLIMANLDYVSEAPAKMYLRNGYKPYERHYAKLL